MDFHLTDSKRKKPLQRFLRQDISGPLRAPLIVLPRAPPCPPAMQISLPDQVGLCPLQVPFHFYYFLVSSRELCLTFQLLIVNQTQSLTYCFSIALVTLNTPYSLIISFIVHLYQKAVNGYNKDLFK